MILGFCDIRGLAAHLLYLSGTEYPSIDKTKPQISNGMWAQYVLDNFATVDEALKKMTDLQVIATKINNKEWPLHLALEDRSGDSAIIEFIQRMILGICNRSRGISKARARHCEERSDEAIHKF